MRPIIIADGAPGSVCKRCDVRDHSVCSAIGDADLARLAATATAFALKKGQVFINEGDPATDFFNVTGGTVKLFKLLPDGRQQITGFAAIGHFLGLAVSDTYAFSAEAVEDVRVCRFSRPKLRRLLDDFPRLERRLLETACNELATAQEQLLLLGRKTAVERVASFLVAWSQQSDGCAHAQEIRLPMTRGDIADYLGLTIETVSRTFSRFRAEKRIATPALNEVVLIDQAWLEDVAEGNTALH
jgi:CRP/FNR family transcriptional regulator, anaerobic regulatory protein